MALQIRLLGGFSVQRDDRPLAFSSRKVAALLAILACQPGALHSRARLADLLWSRSAEAQARGSLRQALRQLRKDLGSPAAPVLEAGHDRIGLNPDGVTVDVAELEAALAEGTPGRLERAAALYTGDFLDGFALNEEPFEEWRRMKASRLRAEALRGLGRLLEHHASSGSTESALALGERLLAIEPASEETHQALMRLHIERGALGSAMRQYERCRTALETELGVPPSEETELLRRRIKARPRPAEAESDAGAPPSLAVLPFANLSEDPAQSYFAQGFTEDVIGELSRFRSVRVLAARSSFVVDPGAAHREIGERLGVRYLLSGSVRRTTRTIRIGAELVDAERGHHVWTHRYDVPFEAILDTQDEIARSVAGALAARLDDAQLKQAQRKTIENLQAYDCWLRGTACLRRGTYESHAEAQRFFERALEIDPQFARAYAGLSLTHFNEWSCLAWDRWAEKESKAFEYASRAVALDESDSATQFILGRILLYRREFERAERHLVRAEELNPSDADILAQLALSHAYLGYPERGIEAGRLAMQLNPFHDDWYFAFAAAPYAFARRLEEAIPLALKAPDVATDMRAYLAAAYAHLGRKEEAKRQVAGFLHIFRRNITFGREPEPDEPARWILHVNPLRREADRIYLLEGLERAGLTMPADLGP